MFIRHFQKYFLISVVCFILSWLTYSYEAIFFNDRETALNEIQKRLTELTDKQTDYIERAASNFSEGSYTIPDDRKNDFPTFIFVNGSLKSWSSNDLIPSYNDLSGDYVTKLITTAPRVLCVLCILY